MNPLFEGLGLEAISFQREGLLFKELSIQFNGMLAAADDGKIEEARANIEKITQARTGLNVNFSFEKDGMYNAYVIPPMITEEHALFGSIYRRALRGGLERYNFEKLLEGTVDLEQGKITGSFTEVPIKIVMVGPYLKSKLFAGEEMAAIYLHECGHAFGYFEFLGRTVISNLAMAETSRIWSETSDPKLRIQVLQEIEKGAGVSFDDKQALALTQEQEAITIVAAKTMARIRSAMGSKFYDDRVFEFVSDQFVSRQGGGRALVTGLDKLNRSVPMPMRSAEYQTTAGVVMLNLISLGKLLWTISMGSKGTGRAVQFTLKKVLTEYGKGLIFSTLFKLILGDGGTQYDSPKARYEAVYRDMLTQLKTRNLPAGYVRNLLQELADIRATTDALQSMPDVFKLGERFLWDTLTGRGKQVAFQQQFEKLANNELFVKAAQFNTLSPEA